MPSVKNKKLIYMAHIYWEKKEIPIPDDAYINHSDGRVFVFIREGKVLEKSHRRVIGRAASNRTMYPNNTFRDMYPSLWEEYYGPGEKQPERFLRAGTYSLCLGAGHSTGVYPMLHEVYGPMYANAIMDFSMYSMLTRSDAAHTLPERMRGEVAFSKDIPSDAWLSDMLCNKMTEEQSLDFRKRWIEHCKSSGVTSAWISIDGSNNDCAARGCSLAEPGMAKSHIDSAIVSYMYAVNAETGMPITYLVGNGGKVDAKAFMKLQAFLGLHGIEAKGVLLDRAFCTPDVFRLLDELGIPYVIMLKSDTYAHVKMYEEHAGQVRWNVRRIVSEDCLFGMASEVKCRIFASKDTEAYLSFFYDGTNGTERSATLIRKVMRERKRLEDKIRDGKPAVVDGGLTRYLSVEEEDGVRKVRCDCDSWQASLNGKGFYSIASSRRLTAAEADSLYRLRDASETQYMFSKSQLGFDVTRNHTENGIGNKFFLCFISSILRSRIQNACKSLHLDTNRMLMEVDRISLCLVEGNLYIAIHDESRRQKDLLATVGIAPADLDSIAEEFNMRKGPVSSQYRGMPKRGGLEKPKRGRPRQEHKEEKPEGNAEKRPVGRPKGSKNKAGKKTAPEMPAKEHKRPGRPKGRKNNATIEAQKPKRGRPKGSKNKKTIEREKSQPEGVKRKPGRPKGSKNATGRPKLK